MIVSFCYDFDSIDDSTISPAFLACHALFAFDSRAQCLSTALSTHVIRNTNDARFSYDHIADGGAMDSRIARYIRSMRSAMRMVESRCDTSTTALPRSARSLIDLRITDSL